MKTDVHAHLDLVKDINSVIERARKKGIVTIITNGGDVQSNRNALQLKQQYDIVQAALGIYPITAKNMTHSKIHEELEFIKNHSDEIVALGEIGLDYQHNNSKQQDVFEKQLNLAKKLRKPVIVHSRKAEKDVIETLTTNDCKKVVLHAFHGNMKLVKKATEHGYYFSIPSNILRSEHFQKLVTVEGVRLLTETDTPFLGPYEDKKSEPAYVALTLKKIAELRKKSASKIEDQIYANYQECFNVKR